MFNTLRRLVRTKAAFAITKTSRFRKLREGEIDWSNISVKSPNKRAEMYFLLAEWVKRGGCLPNRPGLKKELTAPTYYLKNGKFMLEPKDQIKDRLGFSVDEADALALTFALPEMPARVNQFGQVMQKATKAVSDWDPFNDPR